MSQRVTPTLHKLHFGAIKRATLPISYTMVTPSEAMHNEGLSTGTVMADVWELEKKDRGRLAQLLHYWAKDPVTSKVTTFSRVFTLLTRVLDNPFFRAMQQLTRDSLLGLHALMVGREGLEIPGVQLQRQWISDTFNPDSHKTYVMTLGQRTLGYVQTQKMGNTLWLMALENAFWHRRGPKSVPIRFKNVYEGLLHTAMQQQQPYYIGWLPLNERVAELHAKRYRQWFPESSVPTARPVTDALARMTPMLHQSALAVTPRHQEAAIQAVSVAREPGFIISRADQARFSDPIPLPEPPAAWPDSTSRPTPQTAAH